MVSVSWCLGDVGLGREWMFGRGFAFLIRLG